MEELRPWQFLVNQFITLKPSARRVIWLVDPKGGSEKSIFATYHAKMTGTAISLQPDETARQIKAALIQRTYICLD